MTTIADPRIGRFHQLATDTELDAAISVASVTGKLRVQVLSLLRATTAGLTDDEGGALMGGDRLTFGRRRQELVSEGYVRDSGIRRPSPSGRSAIVWEIV